MVENETVGKDWYLGENMLEIEVCNYCKIQESVPIEYSSEIEYLWNFRNDLYL